MLKSLLPKAFLLILLVFVLWACYLIFRPFLIELVAAAILVSFFYRPYEWLAKKLAGSRKIAALIMCLFIVLIVIVPIVNLTILGAQKSIVAYSQTTNYINNNDIEGLIKNSILPKFNLIGFDFDSLKNVFLDVTKNLSNWLIDGAANFVKGTTGFVISLVLIVFTMFFFFVDGKRMLKTIMRWTPLPNKYDIEIFNKFRAISYSTVISTFVTAVAQGLAGAIGFMIVGLPAFFPGIFMGFFSLIPYVGASFVWFPVAVYLLFTAPLWKGIFLMIWGVLLVGTIDNVLRAYLIKGESNVHPIFIIFSILGGISLFGFWGVILGPLIISLAVTILHIYELEYEEVLEK